MNNTLHLNIIEEHKSFCLEKLKLSLQSQIVKGVSRHDAKTIIEAKAKAVRNNLNLSPQTLESEMAFRIYRDMRDSFNFKEDVIGTSDYISMYPNGTAKSEPAIMVSNGVVDIGILQSVLRPEVASKLSYLHPTSQVGKVTAFFKEPLSTFAYDVYTDPFQPNLWCAIFFTWVVIVFIFLLSIALLEKKYLKHHKRFGKLDYADVISWGFSCITQQGWDLDVTSVHLNIAAISGRLTTTVIYGAYCGAIISILSLDISEIKSFEALIKNGFVFESYQPSASMGAYLKDLLSNKRLNQEEIMINQSEVLESLDSLQPRKAFLYYWPYFYQITQESKIKDWTVCESISSVPVDRCAVRAAMVVKKDYKYKEIFNYKIIHIKESGLNKRYQDIYNRNAFPRCPKEDRLKRQRTLGLSEVQFAFLFVIFANITCPAILVFEIMLHNLRSKFRDISAKFVQGI